MSSYHGPSKKILCVHLPKPKMSSDTAEAPTASWREGGVPGSSSSGARRWKLPLLTILGLLMAQTLLYYNYSSFYGAHHWFVVPSSSLRLKWFSDNSTREPSVYSLSLGGSGRDNNRHRDTTPPCPPIPPSLKQERAHRELILGGRYRPENCTARHKVAIIIPYRNRATHLTVFVHHMHPFLQRQQLEYTIYVVEQAGGWPLAWLLAARTWDVVVSGVEGDDSFNRGMLMNVGVLEGLKHYAFDCLVLHDVDLLPEDDRNLYTCLEPPRHMSVAMSTYDYRLPYQEYFGGVSAITAKQFTAINGFSNKFWGWGGEDDDFFNRVRHHGLNVSRYPSKVARYTMLSHKKANPSPDRFTNLRQGKWRFKTDGLNTINYQILKTERRRLFTWLFVALART
ncbi:beta-1,4-galactosyltransferase 2-like isoform X2 [Portunus trituberculatus]|uniref:beta-1,4-galactosyltransferase 2-like isoform X2 n=1 Tax=Portunus trituberculatus TaxID=210409 RepID=UPI001E1CB8BD|nr:beta-1,4-galactosyltransferase 2-like isoform X2 [Portunus trituberculatus]